MYKLAFVFFFLLSACQHTPATRDLSSPHIPFFVPEAPTATKTTAPTSKRDGPPPGPPPVAFEEVIPQDEPLSRYGNPAYYYVKGKKYNVLTSSEGYAKQGIASWYGTRFHKERTSSGEVYDMYALTAAHKTLPLPTYVRVKNLENGREAIVKVNDRGPFYDDRIIDLSYGAATKLGLLPKGTASVEIEALGTTPEAQYYLQVGAFKSKEKASALKHKVIALSPETRVRMKKRDTAYLIHLGPFESLRQSDILKSKLEAQGVLGVFSFLK